MNNLSIKIKVPKGEIESIFNEINKAQETIYKCYNRLQELGVVVIEEKEAVSGN